MRLKIKKPAQRFYSLAGFYILVPSASLELRVETLIASSFVKYDFSRYPQRYPQPCNVKHLIRALHYCLVGILTVIN